MNNSRPGQNTPVLFVILGAIVLAIFTYIAIKSYSNLLINQSFKQLSNIREIKKYQILDLYSKWQNDVRFLSETVSTFGSRKINNTQDRLLQQFIKIYGYYDLFIINSDGDCFYTAAKESEYKTNFFSGKFSKSGLGILAKTVLESQKTGFIDFAPYRPGNGEPASFIAHPLVVDGKVKLIVALQISVVAINNIMQRREGLGHTGEAYLIGPDKLMRSDSYLDPVGHSIRSSFSNPASGVVDTEASNSVISGLTSSKVILDYFGNTVLTSFTPLKIGGTTWGVIVEIDKAEVLSSAGMLANIL